MPKVVLNMEAETGRAKARERKYEKGYAKKVMQDLLEVEPGDDVPQPNAKEMEGWVLSQEILRKTFTVTEADAPVIREYVWDKGLRGSKQTELFEELLDFMQVPVSHENEGRIEKIKNRVQNDSRVVTQVQKMISTDPVDLVARRISGWVKEVRAKDGGPDALQSCGIFYCDNNNRRSVECELKMMLAIKERVLSCPEGLTKLKEAGL